MRIIAKLRRKGGETLTETLVALLVMTMSSVLLFTMVSAANRLNAAARRQDDALYGALQNLAESEQAPGAQSPGTATIKTIDGSFSAEFDVLYSGEAGGLRRYRGVREGETG